MAAFLLLGRGDRSSTIKCAKKEQSMERQSRAHINPDFGAFSALGLRIAALSASRISAVANASHVLPNGAGVRNARSLATIYRAICSFDIRITMGPVKSEDPARNPSGPVLTDSQSAIANGHMANRAT
jgi:hypothetical protein